MKKNIIVMLMVLIATLGVVLNPANVKADYASGVKVLDLEETLADKGITPAFDNYEENDNQVKVYLFRWANCSHCYDFLSYLNSITKEYGYMFKLRSYETSANEANAAVYAKVGKYFNHDEDGVPFIVVGNKYIYGFGEDSKEEFITLLKSEYEKEDRFDVFNVLEESENKKKAEEKEKSAKALYIIIPSLVVILGGIIFLIIKTKD